MIRVRPPAGMAARAFSIRFKSTCSKATSSIATAIDGPTASSIGNIAALSGGTDSAALRAAWRTPTAALVVCEPLCGARAQARTSSAIREARSTPWAARWRALTTTCRSPGVLRAISA